jgi:hypothetical protein
MGEAMTEFPPQPIEPATFMEEFVPAAFAALGVAQLVGDLETDLALGARLEGEGGGDWLYRLRGGRLEVESGSRDEAVISVIQSVEDWRGALWEGRGGVFGRQAAALFRGGVSAVPGLETARPPNFAAFEALRELDGLVRVIVLGGEGDARDPELNWTVDIKLGTGPLPADATTTVSLTEEDARALESGELDPMQAFMAGRVRVEGDMTLMLQMQAVLMQAAQPPMT